MNRISRWTTLTATAVAVAAAAGLASPVPGGAATLASLTLTGQDAPSGPGCEAAELTFRAEALTTTDDGNGQDYLGVLTIDGDGSVLDHDVLANTAGQPVTADMNTDLQERTAITHRKVTIRLVDLPSVVAPGTEDAIATVATALQSPTRATITVDMGDHVDACSVLPYGHPEDVSEARLCEPGVASPFTDTAPGSPHTPNVACAAALALLQGGPAGLAPTQFGPTLTTSRAQLASLVANLLVAFGENLPADPPDAFADDDGSVHERSIDQLAAIGVIGGNGEVGSSFAPTRPATRSEMASFMHRAHDQLAVTPLVPGPDAFADDDADPAEESIDALAGIGVIAGKAPGVFDPGATVTREQIATFFVRMTGPLVDQPMN